MNKYNRSLVILKPDFIRLNLFALLEKLLKDNDLLIISKSIISMNLDFVKKLYQWVDVNYPNEINAYLCSEPMPIWIIQGKNAIIKTMNIKKLLRSQYSVDRLHTLIHCPDTISDFEREYKLLNHGEVMKTKTNNQVEVIIFKNVENKIKYLMFKRNLEKGDFWQPITGNVEIEETFEQAAIRELFEEAGIKDFLRLLDVNYSFEFFDDNRQQLEKVYAVEITPDTKVTLSKEHTEIRWANLKECLNKYLKYPGNKTGLKILAQILEDERNG